MAGAAWTARWMVQFQRHDKRHERSVDRPDQFDVLSPAGDERVGHLLTRPAQNLLNKTDQLPQVAIAEHSGNNCQIKDYPKKGRKRNRAIAQNHAIGQPESRNRGHS